MRNLECEQKRYLRNMENLIKLSGVQASTLKIGFFTN